MLGNQNQYLTVPASQGKEGLAPSKQFIKEFWI